MRRRTIFNAALIAPFIAVGLIAAIAPTEALAWFRTSSAAAQAFTFTLFGITWNNKMIFFTILGSACVTPVIVIGLIAAFGHPDAVEKPAGRPGL
jgi:hypothetical protein